MRRQILSRRHTGYQLPNASIQSEFPHSFSSSWSGIAFDQAGGNLVSLNTTGFPTTTTVKVHAGFSPTVISSFGIVGGASDAEIHAGNLIAINRNLDRVYVHSGLTNTIVNNFASPGILPLGLTVAFGDLVTSDAISNRLYFHSGISGAVANSSNFGGDVRGITFDGVNVILILGNTVYVLDGTGPGFLTTFSAPYSNPIGIAFDGANLITAYSSKIVKHGRG